MRSDDTETKTIAPDVALSLAEGIDATTPAGKLQMHILAAIAEFERERIRERVMAGLKRARSKAAGSGDLGERSQHVSCHRLAISQSDRRLNAWKSPALRFKATWPENLLQLSPSLG